MKLPVGAVIREIRAFFPSRGDALAPQAREIYLNALARGKSPDQGDVAVLQSLGTKYIPGGTNGGGGIVKELPADGDSQMVNAIRDAIRNAGGTVSVKIADIMRNWKSDHFPQMLDNVLAKQTKAMTSANAVILSKKEGVALAEGGVKQWEDELASLQIRLTALKADPKSDPAIVAAVETQVGRATTQKGLAAEKVVALKQSLHAFEVEYEGMKLNIRQTQINVGILKNEWQQSRATGELTKAAEDASKALTNIEDDIILMQARRAEEDAKALAKLRKLNEQGGVSLDPLRPGQPTPPPSDTPPATPPTT
jgi:hypothetical protein